MREEHVAGRWDSGDGVRRDSGTPVLSLTWASEDSGVEPAAGFSSAGLAAVFSDFALLSSSWEHPLASLLGFLKIDITYLRLIQ